MNYQIEVFEELKTIFTINGDSINGLSVAEVFAKVESITKNSAEGEHIFLEVRRVPTIEQAEEIASMFPKSYKVSAVRSHKNLIGSTMFIWIKTSSDKKVSKSGTPKLKKFIEVATKLGVIK